MNEVEEKVKKPTGLATVGILGLLGLAGVLGGYGIYKLGGWLEEREKTKRELIDDYTTELRELIAFHETLVAKGTVTDLDEQILEALTAALAVKEHMAESYSHTWLEEILNQTLETLTRVGIPIALLIGMVAIAGYIVYQVIRAVFKHRPPGGPRPPQCPKCGMTFIDRAAMRLHIKTEHRANTDPVAVLSAQAMFAQQPYWVREAIAVESGTYARAHARWDGLSGYEITMIAGAIATAIAVSIAAPGLGPAAALLLL
ncbi:hypothetical protein ES703_87654 [subsurface metagenome]